MKIFLILLAFCGSVLGGSVSAGQPQPGCLSDGNGWKFPKDVGSDGLGVRDFLVRPGIVVQPKAPLPLLSEPPSGAFLTPGRTFAFTDPCSAYVVTGRKLVNPFFSKPDVWVKIEPVNPSGVATGGGGWVYSGPQSGLSNFGNYCVDCIVGGDVPWNPPTQ